MATGEVVLQSLHGTTGIASDGIEPCPYAEQGSVLVVVAGVGVTQGIDGFVVILAAAIIVAQVEPGVVTATGGLYSLTKIPLSRAIVLPLFRDQSAQTQSPL